ncbi:MAG: tetratricopeptide repeat protein [Acidobacteria bacterium]|nr:tetratricopeptide repeat protein [Acidobacteriota bacterium]NIO59180.1 tetratricopeptide repeat protein [Acidobacteriota bacterium]NIQ85129.1 tetratricopeptide repeat protein [Acidobacteriota bacterium]
MNYDDLDRMYRQGLGMCRKGMVNEAATIFRKIIASGSQEPQHLSYHGLLSATVNGQKREGLRLCERAMRFDPSSPDVALNLARLYELNGRNLKAVETLRRGLRASPGHPRMLKQINRLSPRKRPPLSMVHRNNPINKQLAIMMARITGRYGKEEDSSRSPNRQLRPAKTRA